MDIKWQKMYEEWMAATEAKLQELQQANALLYVFKVTYACIFLI